MAHEWFVVRANKEVGPFTTTKLKEMADEGKLTPEHLVRRSDQDNSRKAGTIKGLFAERSEENTPEHEDTDSSATTKQSQLLGLPKKTIIIASIIAGSCLFICCGGCGVVSYLGHRASEAEAKELSAADIQWSSGKKAEAVVVYKNKRNSPFLKGNDRAVVYGKLIDFEYENGRVEAGHAMIDEAVEKGVVAVVSHADAKAALTALQAEKAEQKRLAETKKNEEEDKAKLERMPVAAYDRSDAVKFLDAIHDHKGRKVRLKINYGGGGLRKGGRLISMVGLVVHRSGSFEIAFEIPADAPQPNITTDDDLMVTFLCKEGDLRSGNIVIKIERP